MKKVFVSVLVVSVFIFLLSTAAFAATVPVSIVDFAFSPQNITIEVGDTVVWTNNGAFPHTTTSGTNFPTGNGIWDSHVLSPGQFFPFTFTQPGLYPYFCSIHGFTGGITVNAPTLPMPLGRHTTEFPAFPAPALSTIRDDSRPIAVGQIATGGSTLTVQVGIEQYAVAVDMFLAFLVSNDPRTIVNVMPDHSFQRFPRADIGTALATGQPPSGMVPWMSNVTAPVNATIFADRPVSGIPPGKYTVFLLVAPHGGGLTNFDLYRTDFTIGVPITTVLSGAQEVPPVTTTATATANFAVNFDTGVVKGTIAFSGLTSAATEAHFHQAAAGVPGPVILALTGGAGSTSGVWTISGTFTPADLAALRSDGLYLNIHSANFLNGEIRGQVSFPDIAFETTLDGSQEVPPTGSSASGVANYTVNINTGAVSGTVAFSGLTSAATEAHFHQAAAGVPGPVILALTGGAGSTSGVWTISGTFTPADLTALGSDGLYLNIHSVNFLNGEIRGQVYYPPGVPLP
ncbi:MAG: CHRD domain-containing protein [Thermodesulfovibrionales bacterium]